MASEIQRNAILIGYVDYYCLVCHSHMKCEEEVANHIAKPVHKKNIDSTSYLEEYKQDLILKVQKGYYCVFCCLLIPTVAKVGLHVFEKSHVNNKGMLQLKRFKNYVIAFDELLIEEKAWSGLTGDSCVLCQVEYEEEDIHKSKPTHVLNLIKYKVEFGVPRSIYRMIDDNAFHCITCNEVFSTSNFNTHFEEKEHKKLLLKCMAAYKYSQYGTSEQEDIEPESKDGKSTFAVKSLCDELFNENMKDFQSHRDTKIDNRSLIVATINKFEKNQVKINLDTETAFCRKCCDCVKFHYETIMTHIEDHYLSNDKKENTNTNMLIAKAVSKEKPAKVKCDKVECDETQSNTANLIQNNNSEENKIQDENQTTLDESIEEYSKRNMIIYNKANREADCRLCKVNIPATFRSLKEHVNGLSHKTKHSKMDNTLTTPKTTTKHIPKRQFKYAVFEVISVSSLFISEEILDRKYCIEKYSFYMITRTGSGYRCQLCEENLEGNYVETHFEGSDHKDAMFNTPIITLTSLETEFIREVRTGLYHCGFCNWIAANWGELENHLMTKEHKQLKQAASKRLQLHMMQLVREDAMANYIMKMLLMRQ